MGLVMTSRPLITLPIIQYLIDMPSPVFFSLCHHAPLWIVAQHCFLLHYFLLQCLFGKQEQFCFHQDYTEFPVCKKKVEWKVVGYEVFRTLTYTLMFYVLDPLVAFSVFFGVWHSSITIYNSIVYLKQHQQTRRLFGIEEEGVVDVDDVKRISLKDIIVFYVLAMPYTTVSFLGMVLVYTMYRYTLILQELGLGIPHVHELDLNLMWAVFIGCISVLTGPHMWVLLAFHQTGITMDPLKISYVMESFVGED